MAASLNQTQTNLPIGAGELNNEELMRLVCRMQALVRGTLIRRSVLKLRAEFEEISRDLGPNDTARTPANPTWSSSGMCLPRFTKDQEESDVLERLSKKQWRKTSIEAPQPPHPQISCEPLKHGEDDDVKYSSDFQSSSSSSPTSSSDLSQHPSSQGSSEHHHSAPSERGAEESDLDVADHSNKTSLGGQDARKGSASVDSSRLTFDHGRLPSDEKVTTEPETLTKRPKPDEEESHESMHQSPESSERMVRTDEAVEDGLHREIAEKESNANSVDDELNAADSVSVRGREKEDAQSKRQVCASKDEALASDSRVMYRQSFNETDLTLVSSIDTSSVRLSSSEDDVSLEDAVREDSGIERRLPQVGSDIEDKRVAKPQMGEGGCDVGQYSNEGHDASNASGYHDDASLQSLHRDDVKTESSRRETKGLGEEREGIGSREVQADLSGVQKASQSSSQSSSPPTSTSSSSSSSSSSSLHPLKDAVVITSSVQQGAHMVFDNVPSTHQPTNSQEPGLHRHRGNVPSQVTTSPKSNSKQNFSREGHIANVARSQPESQHNALTSDGSGQGGTPTLRMGLDCTMQRSISDVGHTDSHDASVAADMTSIWSTDQSDIDERVSTSTMDGNKLREMRNNTAMELLWIQQAIESRKNYLRLKSKIGREGTSTDP